MEGGIYSAGRGEHGPAFGGGCFGFSVDFWLLLGAFWGADWRRVAAAKMETDTKSKRRKPSIIV